MNRPAVQIRSTLFALMTLSSLLFSISLPVPRTSSAPKETKTNSIAKLATETAKERALKSYGNLPLRFELNQGQTDESVKFLTRAKGYSLFLTLNDATLALQGMATTPKSAEPGLLRMKFVGSRRNAEISGVEQLQGKVNYLIGKNRNKWQTDVPAYREVRYRELWHGIDMVWHGRQHELEYDFVVQPGADPSRIRLSFEGADNLRIDDQGNLLAKTNAGGVVQRAPVIYQNTDGERRVIEGKYELRGTKEIGFVLGDYDQTKPLVIDPILVYSTFLGGDSLDEALGVAADNLGQVYVVGKTRSNSTFPIRNAFQSESKATVAFVSKLNATGSDILYSTFLGDDSVEFCHGSDDAQICGTQAQAVAVGVNGEAVVTGAAINFDNDSEFPVTPNAFQGRGLGCVGACGIHDIRVADAFVTVLTPDGSDLIYSTFFGGSAIAPDPGSGKAVDAGKSVAVDSSGRIYIAGHTASNELPIKNGFQRFNQSSGEGTDAFIAVFDPTQERGNNTLLYSSYLGGSKNDIGRGIAVDNSRNAYVVGSTASEDLSVKSPSSLPPLQDRFQGGSFDGFVAKIDTASEGDASLTYLTYFGGDINDRVESIAVDSAQRAYITGATNSSPERFPLHDAFDSTQTNGEAFVAKLNADGTALFYCSFLGGENTNTPDDGEEGLGIAIDPGGNAYVTGRTTSGNSFPVGPLVLPFPDKLAGTAFVSKISVTGKILYATTFGGKTAFGQSIALDPRGNVYLAGITAEDLPTTAGAFQSIFNGSVSDGFVAKIAGTFNDTIGVFRAPNEFLLRNSNTTGPPDISTTFGVAGDLPVTGDWDGNGTDDIGVFRPGAGQFQLRVPTARGFVTVVLNFGQNGDLPVAGDWNGDGTDTVGVFTPSTGQWRLTNGPNLDNTTPPVILQFTFGVNGDTPIAGDWNGDGVDTPGLFRGGIVQFILSNDFQGTNDIPSFSFGPLGTRPLAGDWDGDGITTVGVFNPVTGEMVLNNTNTAGNGLGDLIFNFGQNGDTPLAGDWDGKPEAPLN